MSAPGQPPSSSWFPSPATVVPTTQIALSSLNLDAVQASLTTTSRAGERVAAQAALELDHATLQRASQTERDRVDALDRESRDAHAAAAPFVQFCQLRYDLARHELRELQISQAEALDVLADRHDSSREIAAIRDQLRLESETHDDVVTYLHAQIDGLKMRTDN
ncbi:hypothetical protein PHYPSEUDO_011188 [Phytophthora pseudosyringae]|uniref:Uncharacterized protein n=1 Tax=Phytophthora pseudosyringae TaxID=221518 RepID=A0A8T1VDR8_9STRA|nr:hypothetical protein PHYPSEUDO_011188 [Phytophthora pseudosyringae]